LSSNSIHLGDYWRLLRQNRNFRRLWFAQIISESGDWFYMVALYAMLLEFTGRAEVLGLAFVMQVLPQALTGPLAGIVNDRLRRRRVMIFTDLARAVIVGCMLLVRTPQQVWLVYPLLALETVMWGTFEPARNAVVPGIVGKDEVILANTLSSTTWSFNLFLGSAVGGVVAAFLGRDFVFGLNALSFVLSAILIAGMRFDEPHMESQSPLRLRDLWDYSFLLEGIRYVRRQRGLTAAVLVKAGLGATGASWIIFPIMGKRIFPVSWHGISGERGAVLGMALLMGARGAGALIGPLLTAPWTRQDQPRLRLAILWGFLLYGSGYVALAYASQAGVAYTVIALSHIGGAMVWVFSTTLLQVMTEDNFRGRVFSADLSFFTLSMAISAYLAGAAMDRGYSVRGVTLATAIATVAVGIIWAWWGVRIQSAASPTD
jgi:MFS family permease